MTGPLLICLHGQKGSGKDLTAKMLMKYLPKTLTFAFGDKLKRICAMTFDVPIPPFYDEDKKEVDVVGTGMSPRQMMTSMANVLKPAYGDDIFARDLRGAWWAAQNRGSNLIVTDLRHEVEEGVCRGLGAQIVHIQREGPSAYTDFSHISEQPLQFRAGDKLLENSQDKGYLLGQVRELILDLRGPDALRAFPYAPSDPLEF